MYLTLFLISLTTISTLELQLPNCHTTKTSATCNRAPKTILSRIPSNITHLTLFEMDLQCGTALNANLTRLKKLEYLNVSENRLDTFPLSPIKALASLTNVILRGNLITTLPVKLATINRNITIDVSQNPIQCTCATVYIVEKSTTVKLIGHCDHPIKSALNLLNSTILNCHPCLLDNGNCLHGRCMQSDALTCTCLCTPGFTGRFCSVPMIQRECDQNECKNGGTCFVQSLDNSTFCACSPGTNGEFCQITSKETNEEDSNIIVAIVVPIFILLVIIAIGCWYYTNLHPKKRRLRSDRKRKQKNSTSSNNELCAQVNVFKKPKNIKN